MIILSFVETPKKLNAPEVRELTPAEEERLRRLGEDMAEQALGPDWKKKQPTKKEWPAQDSGLI
jgi:hypothetical protein